MSSLAAPFGLLFHVFENTHVNPMRDHAGPFAPVGLRSEIVLIAGGSFEPRVVIGILFAGDP
jgi:hypothetical protein